jgi:hypothetical protein
MLRLLFPEPTDAMTGDSSLFKRVDMIEGGSAAAREMLQRDGRHWKDI